MLLVPAQVPLGKGFALAFDLALALRPLPIPFPFSSRSELVDESGMVVQLRPQFWIADFAKFGVSVLLSSTSQR